MRENLPYQILLVLAVAIGGFAVLYNVVLRESYATTIWYEYPAVVQSSPKEEAASTVELPTDFGEELLGQSSQEAGQAGGDNLTTPDSVQFPLDVNTATTEQLKFIPRVGDVMAQRIVQYREALGGYTDLEQLREIKGVGDSTYELLWSYLYIAGGEGDGSAAESEE